MVSPIIRATHSHTHTLFTEEKTLFKMPAMLNIEQQFCQIDRKKKKKKSKTQINQQQKEKKKSKTRPQGPAVIRRRAVCQTKEEKPAVGA